MPIIRLLRSHLNKSFAFSVFVLRLAKLLFVLFSVEIYAADITTLRVQNLLSQAQANVPFTIGHVFAPGDVTAGRSVYARISGGSSIELQVDKKAKHADGSLRHAVLTGLLPAIQANATQTVILSDNAETAPTTSVSLSELLNSSFDAQITINVSGVEYKLAAKDLLSNTANVQWLSGSQVSEWIVGASFKDNSGNAHPHLAGYFHVRAYAGEPISRVRVDVVIENNWSFVASPQDYNYTVSINVGGVNENIGSLNHYHHSRWHKVYWWGDDPKLYARQDVNYIQDSQAVPKYESVQLSEAFLNALRDSTAPMDNGDHADLMPGTGYHPAIGPLPLWDASYLVSGDQRTYLAVLANADAGGSYGAHYRDSDTARPLSIVNHPSATLQNNSLPEGSGSNPHAHDQAHQPSIGYLAYLITGDWYYLEELQFWAVWNFLYAHAEGYREYEKGIFGVQVRGQAWALRTLGQVAYITPDNDELKDHFVASVGYNLTHNEALYSKNSNANPLGMIRSYDGLRVARPWMDDFYTFAMGYLVDLGFTQAVSMRDWKSQYVLNRIGKNAEYCWQFATHYSAYQGPDDSNWYNSFDEFWEGNWGNKQANGKNLTDVACGSPEMTAWLNAYDGENAPYQDNEIYGGARPYSATSYFANMQPAVAVAVDAGLPGSDLAYQRFYQTTPVRPDFTDTPQWAVIPRTKASNVSVLLTADDETIAEGTSTTLNWNSTQADSCTASGAWSGARSVSGSEVISPTVSGRYTLSCSSSQGSNSTSVDIVVIPAGTPIIYLSAQSESIPYAGSTVLNWSTVNAVSCSASGAWNGNRATAGSESSGPLTSNSTFTLNCSGTENTSSASVTINVSPAVKPTLVLSANPSSVNAGQLTTLSWSSNAANTCSASMDWSGARALSGDELIGPINASSQFRLECVGDGGSVSKTVTVFVYSDAPTGMLDNEDFEAYAIGADPANWYDSAAGNSMEEDDSLFSVADVSGNKAFSTGVTNASNIHSHYVLEGSDAWSNYRYSGRMQISNSNDSIGVTAYSDYPNSDAYYRLRREAGGSFQLSTHGIGLECSGEIDTGIIPQVNIWYWFTLQVENIENATRINANVWADGDSEPTAWQVDCMDVNTRRNQGRVGLWAVVSGQDAGIKYWDDLRVAPIHADSNTDLPTVSLLSNRYAVARGETVTLNWSSNYADSCMADGAWSGTLPLMGTQSTGMINADAEFIITCRSNSGLATDSIHIAVYDAQDDDADGIPDAWERAYFPDLNHVDTESDYDGDGVPDILEYYSGTNPTSVDSDGDGESDYLEIEYGSDPTDSSDVWTAHRPEAPLIVRLDQPRMLNANWTLDNSYFDIDGDARAYTQWQISTNADFDTRVFDRDVHMRDDLNLPFGVLQAANRYWLRARHFDSKGLPSAWSDVIQFDTVDNVELDGDSNGTYDAHQVNVSVDSNNNGINDQDEVSLCNLYDAQMEHIIGISTNKGVINCINTISELQLNPSHIPTLGLPFGLFSFSIDGLIVDVNNPSQVVINVFYPNAIPDNARWYKFDHAEQRMSYDNGANIYANTVTFTLTDGGIGDADGVVNGRIVDPSGIGLGELPDSDAASEGGNSSSDGEGTQDVENNGDKDDKGGGGSLFLGWLILCVLRMSRLFHNKVR